MTDRTFPLGNVVATPGALAALEEADVLPLLLLGRHLYCDWGDVCKEDWESNDAALLNGSRLFSSYHLDGGFKIWVITEWDRSATTILLPDEY